MMKVGLISYHAFFQPGGVKRHILGLQEEFKKRGIHSKIIAPRRKRAENYGKNVILLGTSFPIKFSGAQSDFAVNFNPLGIEQTLREEKFDVLHFHNIGLSAIQILERSDSLNILTFHASLQGNEVLKRFPVILKIAAGVARWKIDGIIGIASFNLKPFRNYSGPKIVIPNGIDLGIFNPRVPKIKNPALFPKEFVNILFLGRIEERKGLIYLLKALKILEKKLSLPFRLVVVGEGPLKNYCQNWIRKNKLKNIVFQGQVAESDVPSYYRSCDIFCSPAIFGESFGLVLVEAMACQKPVAAFANEGYKGVLTGRGARFLAKPRDYKTLAQKLEILIKDKKLRKAMGDWGVKESKKYAWQKVANQILDFYEFCRREKEKAMNLKIHLRPSLSLGQAKPKPSFSLEKSLKKLGKNFDKPLKMIGV